jgi:1,4-dihydroxy-2-naphthoate octaprenyltransferase
LYALLLGVALVALALLAWSAHPLALLGLVFLVPALPAARLVLSGASGRELIPVLQRTGIAELVYAAGMFLGLLLA